MFKVMFKMKDGEIVFDDNEFTSESEATTYGNTEMLQMEGENIEDFEVVETGK